MAYFLDDIIVRLVAQGVGTAGVDIFTGSQASLPSGDGPYISLTETGGVAPGGFIGGGGRNQNQAGAATRRPGAQVLVRARTYQAARAKAEAAWLALDGIWNTTLNGTFYQSLTARQEPTDVGLDAAKRVMISFNIDAEKSA